MQRKSEQIIVQNIRKVWKRLDISGAIEDIYFPISWPFLSIIFGEIHGFTVIIKDLICE